VICITSRFELSPLRGARKKNNVCLSLSSGANTRPHYPYPLLMERLSLRVTTLLSLRATTTERLSLRVTTLLSLRATTTLPPPHTRTHWPSHCPATLPLPPLVKRLSLRVTTLMSFRATTRRLSPREGCLVLFLAGAHTLMMAFMDAGRMLPRKSFPAYSVAAGPCRTCQVP
jgi:hypothetical protein